MNDCDAGIIDLEVYFPKFYIEQTDLEIYDGCVGKYVNGLGQTRMAIPSILEDPVSMALTTVHRIMERRNISYSMIGRLDVGTESLIDLSKSIKSQLMMLFEKSGNHSVEGADNVNACYGGTAALFNVVNWMQSSSWNGKLGLVVTTDIAIYSNDIPSARATGGCGSVCMLIGRNPVICLENLRGHYMGNYYDFYKPVHHKYPIVDGKLSQGLYIKSLLSCFSDYRKSLDTDSDTLEGSRIFCFHCPYSKLARKSYGYMKHFFHDSKESALSRLEELYKDENQSERVKLEKSIAEKYNDEMKLVLDKGMEFCKIIGNSYCSSLFFCLASVIFNYSTEYLANRRIIMFSYGSGCLSSMYSFKISSDSELIYNLKNSINKQMSHISQRVYLSPEAMISWFNKRFDSEKLYQDIKEAQDPSKLLFKNTYYIKKIDEKFRRFYQLYN